MISCVRNSHASTNYTTDYQVEYFLQNDNGMVETHVKFIIKITNLKSDVYVKQFGLTFPKYFQISNVKASDDKGPTNPAVAADDTNTKIQVEFNNPEIGKNTENYFTIDFDQQNLFRADGAVWEVILPTLESRGDGAYKVIVHLPPTTDKKISIAKPAPTFIRGNEIVWQNPNTKTIYAVFGNKQYYDVSLSYNLENPGFTRGYTEIALPPDTLYQKTYLTRIDPLPSKVSIDEDGNFMARYDLSPKEKKVVNYAGVIELSTTNRIDVKEWSKNLFEQQKNYLLTSQKYWELPNPSIVSQKNDAYSLYTFTRDALKYNYGRLNSNLKRLGAATVLSHPDQAVCTEFTDVFVAAAREKGIYAREIEGYGFANDQQIRPVSLVSDVLHAWPEYYDTEKQLWIPVDPTWENTSGIDYFHSFDLNHIVFAIHGKNSDYPSPAGTYKTEQSKDISIKSTTEAPRANESVEIHVGSLPAQITEGKNYLLRVRIKNTGNVYVWNIPIAVKSQNIDVSSPSRSIPILAPFQEVQIDLPYKPSDQKKSSIGTVLVHIGSRNFESATKIVPYYQSVAMTLSLLLFGVCVIALLLKFTVFKKKR